MISPADITITNTRTGVPYRVHIVEIGGRYGLNDCLTHEQDEWGPMVEFYDISPMRNYGPPEGQFVSRYYISTLRDDEERLGQSGLCLDGGIPKWILTAANLRDVFAYCAATEGAPR
jgi:hypothetical protein